VGRRSLKLGRYRGQGKEKGERVEGAEEVVGSRERKGREIHRERGREGSDFSVEPLVPFDLPKASRERGEQWQQIRRSPQLGPPHPSRPILLLIKQFQNHPKIHRHHQS
jgi:hypothetical protein